MPEPSLVAYIRMKPIIEAQESMQHGKEALYGVARVFGANDLANEIWRSWERVANATSLEEVAPQRTARDDRNAFITMMRNSGLKRGA